MPSLFLYFSHWLWGQSKHLRPGSPSFLHSGQFWLTCLYQSWPHTIFFGLRTPSVHFMLAWLILGLTILFASPLTNTFFCQSTFKHVCWYYMSIFLILVAITCLSFSSWLILNSAELTAMLTSHKQVPVSQIYMSWVPIIGVVNWVGLRNVKYSKPNAFYKSSNVYWATFSVQCPLWNIWASLSNKINWQ